MPTIPVAAGTSDVQVISERCVLLGYTVEETAGSTAEFELLNGTSSSGKFIDGSHIPANNTVGDSFPGIVCEFGVFLNRISGTTRASIRIR